MSFSFENHLLIQQLQIKPHDFLHTISQMSDESILVFISNLFMNGDIELFHSFILFIGQEHQNNKSIYVRVLEILQQYHDDIYFYILDKLVPIIVNYHISIEQGYFHYSILHLSNYEPLLTKCIQFVEHMDNLPILIAMIRDIPHLHQPLIFSINKYDSELAELIHENIYRTKKVTSLLQEVNNLNEKIKLSSEEIESGKSENNNLEIEELNNIEADIPEISENDEINSNNLVSENLEEKKTSVLLKTEDPELKSLEEIPDDIIDQSQSLIDKAINNISDFQEIPHGEIQQQSLENNIDSEIEKKQTLIPDNKNNLNTNLIKQVSQESLKENKKEFKNYTFEEFVNKIPEEKLLLLSNFMRRSDNDAYLTIGKNKTHLNRILKPSCEKMNLLINNPVLHHNKLGTNYQKIDLGSIGEKVRGEQNKPILYLDAMDGIFCEKNKNNTEHLCTYQNPYGDFFYKYENHKFNLKKQMYNLDVWLLLLDNIQYFNKVDHKKIGKLTDLYSVVFVVHKYILEQLVGEIEEPGISMIQKNGFTFISAEDKITHELLNFYLFSKFYQEGDLLLTGENYTWLHHGEGIAINGDYKQVEEFLPFMISDVETLNNVLSQFYLNYNFLVHKISLGVIKRKKLSKKKRKKRQRLSRKK